MTKYIIGEIFSSGGATLYKNPYDQTVSCNDLKVRSDSKSQRMSMLITAAAVIVAITFNFVHTRSMGRFNVHASMFSNDSISSIFNMPMKLRRDFFHDEFIVIAFLELRRISSQIEGFS